MHEAAAAEQADQLMLSAYQDERQRAYAVRWLGWIAYHMGDGHDLSWWIIPSWVPGRRLRLARLAVAGTVSCAAAGLAYAVYPWAVALPVGLALLLGYSSLQGKVPMRAPRPEPPREVVPRWPQPGEIGGLAVCLVLVVPFVPFLLRTWSVPAAGPAERTYRAERRTTALGCAGWMLGTLALGLIAAALWTGFGRWLVAMVPLAGGAGLVFALYGNTYSLVKLAELVLSVQWRDQARFRGVLADAVRRGVLREHGTILGFTSPDVQDRLAGLHQAALTARAAARETRLTRRGARSALLAFLTEGRIIRISIDTGAGAGASLLAGTLPFVWGQWAGMAGVVIGAVTVALLAAIGPYILLEGLVRSARWTLANIPGPRGWPRLAVAAGAAAAAGVVIAGFGPALAAIGAWVLPAAFTVACGVWAGLLARRRARGKRWLKPAPDLIFAATTAAALLLLARRDLLTTEPAAALLFPPAAWGSVRIWRAMDGSGRLLVRAAADVTLSSLLAAELVVFLVWLANLLDLASAEVAALRAVLARAGTAADLPWWVWTGSYALLAAVAVGYAARPSRLPTMMRWFGRLRVAGVTSLTRRVLTCVHISLMAVVLIGLVAPPVLAPTFQRQLRAKYTVALQREFDANGAAAAYQQIRRHFAAAAANQTLIRVVTEIHDTSSPPAGSEHATATETDLARRLGELQALVLAPKAPASPPALPAAEQATARQSGFDAPLRDGSDLENRVGEVHAEEKKDDAAAKRAEQAGDLAAAAIASTISIANISDNEVYQIIREYLGGLIEGSRLKDVFAAWAAHLGGRSSGDHSGGGSSGTPAPPDAGTMVVPDPVRIREAAFAQLNREFTAASDPILAYPAFLRALGESPLTAAVDMLNQARYLQENSGPCAGCAHDVHPGEHDFAPPEDHPVVP